MLLQKFYFSNVFNGLVKISLVSMGLLIGCHADEYPESVTTQVSVTGTVVDAGSDTPLAGVSVRSDNNAVTVLTDDKGLFLLENVGVNKIGEVIITFFKEGYPGNQKVFVVEHGKTYSTELALQRYEDIRVAGGALAKEVIINDPTVETIIEIPSASPNAGNPEAVLVFPANSIGSGKNYTVEAVVLDPKSDTVRQRFPGFFLTAPFDFFRPDALLESVAFVNVLITDEKGTQVTSLLKPAIFYLRLSNGVKDGTYQEGDSIGWWSFRNTRGHWGQELANAIVTIPVINGFPGIDQLYVEVDVSQLTWFNAGPQIKALSCLGVSVVEEADGVTPVAGAVVIAEGVSYFGNSLPVITNNNGFAQLLVKPSDPSNPETVRVTVRQGVAEFPLDVTDASDGNIGTETINTSTIADSFIIKDGVEYGNCKNLISKLMVDVSGTVSGQLTYLGSGASVPNYPVYTNIGISVKSDENGFYTMRTPTKVKANKTLYVFASVEYAKPVVFTTKVFTQDLIVQTPVITSLTRTPSGTVVAENQVIIKVSATDLEDPLLAFNYVWTSKDDKGIDVGSFNDTTLAEVVWTAPPGTGVANINVVVDNGLGGSTNQTLIVNYEVAAVQ